MRQNTSTNSLLRPPIIAILGHVDHGKTTLLDRIRSTNIIAREAGGITQSIGAWQIEIPRKEAARDEHAAKITFIDTPGHAAFQAMRARGAQIADIAVLVIAADDGVMPQTKESLEFIRESKTPFLVAITKIDLQTANIEKVKNQLLELEVVPEEYGGDVVVIPVSSKTGEGIENLLDMIVLVAELSEIKGIPKDPLEAIVLETQRDPARGIVASLVVKAGTLKIGDILSAENVGGKVRGLFDGARHPIQQALPGDPVEVIGFEALPPVGAKVTSGEKTETVVQKREIPKIEGFSVVLRADKSGSLEAILGQLGREVTILSAGVGEIVENDVKTAAAAGSVIVGFNVKVAREVAKLAEEEGVKIYTYRIIYELLQERERWIKEAQKGPEEKILGKAQIIAQFSHGKQRIAGCKVLEGRITRSDRLRLVRGEEILGGVRILSMKQLKEEVDKAGVGEEFGILFEPQFDFQIGDVLESYSSQ